MASFSFDQMLHRVHALAQRSPRKCLWVAALAGLVGGLALALATALPRYLNAEGAQAAVAASLAQTTETIAKLKIEKVEQQAKLQKLAMAPATAESAALSTAGYTEEDVAYWRKQMDAYGLMSGVRLTIVGRGVSRFNNATQLTVSLKTDPATLKGSGDLIKALDFLQVYGYVESFNGTEAVVHIPGVISK